MPFAAKRQCRTRPCPKLVRPPARRCPEHEAEHGREERERRTPADPFYQSPRWRRIRREHLALEPNCRTCARAGAVIPGTDVDHVVPRHAGGSDEHENLQSLCRSHHSQKTATEDGGFGRDPGGKRANSRRIAGGIIDEIHEQGTRELWDRLQAGRT